MNFGMITLNQNIKTEQNYAKWILTALLFMSKFYEDIADDVKKWLDTSDYNEDDKIPLPIVENEKIIGLFKDELGGKIMIEFAGLRIKTYAYLMDDNSERKRVKGTKQRVTKKGLMLKNYKDCFFNDKIILKPQQRFKSDCHSVYAGEINKIVLSSNDDKRFDKIQIFDKITTYSYRTDAFKVCESEMISKI